MPYESASASLSQRQASWTTRPIVPIRTALSPIATTRSYRLVPAVPIEEAGPPAAVGRELAAGGRPRLLISTGPHLSYLRSRRLGGALDLAETFDVPFTQVAGSSLQRREQ